MSTSTQHAAHTDQAAPIIGNYPLGAAVFGYNIPPGTDGSYDTQAVVTISVSAIKSQAHLFTPQNPNWVQNGIKIGNAAIDVNMSYAPPVAGGQLGSLTVNSSTLYIPGQSPQQFNNAVLVSWDTSGQTY